MPAFIALIWEALLAILPALIWRILLALGISAVAYKGFDAAFGSFGDYLFGKLGQTSSDVYNVLSFTGLIAAIKMHLALFTAIATLKAGDRVLKIVSKSS